MSNIYVTSDTHFGHAAMLEWVDSEGYPRRGEHWDTVEQMNAAIVDNWNSVVGPKDTVYHLGDVFYGSKTIFLESWKQLNGIKHLVLGNHDDSAFFIKNNLVKSVKLFHKDKALGVILSHMPLREETMYDLHNVHGHLHYRLAPKTGRHTCVSLEQTNYKPICLESLSKSLTKRYTL